MAPVECRLMGKRTGSPATFVPKSARTLSDGELVAAFARRMTGSSMKTLTRETGVHRDTLRAHFKRLAEQLASTGGLPRTIPSVVENARGIAQRHLAETVHDLYELVHFRKVDGEVTLSKFGKIIGASDDTAWHRFYELRKSLRRYGLRLGKRLPTGSLSRMDAVLVFNFAKLKAFVGRELGPAEEVLARFKGRTKFKGRFRGSTKA